MKFSETPVADAYVVDLERIGDSRGFFARTWCGSEFALHGLDARVAQCNVSFNHRQGTVRGLHYQSAPYAEAKVVRCTMGAIFDAIVDLRPASPTYLKTCTIELTASNRRMLYVPEGVAHGFQTLTDDTEVLYMMSTEHQPTSARGVRWNDPTLALAWPLPVSVISDRDRSLPWISDL